MFVSNKEHSMMIEVCTDEINHKAPCYMLSFIIETNITVIMSSHCFIQYASINMYKIEPHSGTSPFQMGSSQ